MIFLFAELYIRVGFILKNTPHILSIAMVQCRVILFYAKSFQIHGWISNRVPTPLMQQRSTVRTELNYRILLPTK